MLIKCPECGHDVSSTAEKCPNCGAEVSQRDKKFGGEEGITIRAVQFTSKRWKTQRIWSWVVFFVGFLLFILQQLMGVGRGELLILSFIIMTASMIWGIIIILNTWWHHG